MRTGQKLVVLGCVVGLAAGCGSEIVDTAYQTRDLDVEQSVDIETDHPYANWTEQSWEVEAPAGALRITLHLDRFETEYGYDLLEVFDGQGRLVQGLSGEHSGESITVEGSAARLRFTSDWLYTGWGFRISRYTYEFDEPVRPDDHRPYCGAIGSRSEGWYWGDTGERIRFERCADLAEPECGAIGSRSEGWYSSGEPALIAWDRCHNTDGWSLVGEPCGPAINRSCHESYCHGLPDDPGILGGTGVCRDHGTCETAEDCERVDNLWIHALCTGRASCEANRCAWHCGVPVDEGPWSWTTMLLRDIESPHPYPNDFDDTWDVTREGASKVRVHFQRIETEKNYDRIVLSGDREEHALMIDGNHTDYWSPEFNGDTIHIALETDYSVTQWGFRADMLSFYSQLPPGMCNRDEDCADMMPGSMSGAWICLDNLCTWQDGQVDGRFENLQKYDIPDADPAGVRSAIEVDGMAECPVVATVGLSIRHSYRGDLVVSVIDPSGHRAMLHQREGRGADDLVIEDLTLPADLGQPSAKGTWVLEVSDHAAWDLGTLERWSLELACR